MKRFALYAGMAAFGAAAIPVATSANVPGGGLWLEQVRRMSPQALAEMLLGPGHPPIRSATIRPEGMDAPTPWVTAVEFSTVPAEGPGNRFCEWQSIVVGFAPVPSNSVPRDGLRPAVPTTTKRERRLSTRPEGQDCAALAGTGIAIDRAPPGTLRLLADLDAAQVRAQAGRRLPFPVTFKDTMADQIRDPAFVPWRSSRDALRWFPLSAAFVVRPYEAGTQDLGEPKPRSGEERIQLLSNSSAILVYRRSDFTITRIHIARYIPAPF